MSGATPERRIVGLHQDEEGHWVADLACGHTIHVRHDPPWQVRPWVLTAESRAARLGTTLPCRACGERPAGEPTPYEDARLCGLCEDGALEVDARRRPPGAGTGSATK